MRNRTLTIGLLFFCIVWQAGCGGSPPVRVQISPELRNSPGMTIAVLPFERGQPITDRQDALENNIEIKDAGNAVSDMFTSELMRVPGFRLVERSQIKKVLNELKLSLSELIAEKTAQEIGKLLGVQAVVLGHVAELRWGTNAVGWQWFSFSYSFRIVATESGLVLASAYVAQNGWDTTDVAGRCHQSVRAVVDRIIEKRAKR